MENNKNVPAIRFKGFTDAWEQQALSNYMQKSNDDVLNVTSSEQLMTVKLNLQGIEVFSNSRDLKFGKTKYFKRKSGSFIYGKQNLFNGAFGIVPDYLDGYGTSGDVPTLKTTGDLDNKYLVYLLQRSYKNLEKYSTGSGSKRIHETKFLSFKVVIPSLAEQQKIVSFLEKIDQSITLHQRKLEMLENIKKSMLEKLFPTNSSRYPQIRFAGFADAWEQCELGSDVADIVGGGTPSTSNPNYWNGDIDWYSPTEIGEEIYATGSRKKITREGLENSSAKILPANKTILFTSRAGIGDMAILKQSGATNQGFQSLVVKEDFHPYFVFSMGNIIKKYALQNASGSTFLEISPKNLSKMEIFCPSKTEQIKIGQFFANIDTSITLHQRNKTTIIYKTT